MKGPTCKTFAFDTNATLPAAPLPLSRQRTSDFRRYALLQVLHPSLRDAVRVSLIAALCLELSGCCSAKSPRSPARTPQTFSSFDVGKGQSSEIAVGAINFANTDLRQVLDIYQEISKRTVIRPTTLPSPTISVRNQTPLTKVQALQLLDSVLAQNGIAMVLAGETAVKAVPEVRAVSEAPPEITLPWRELPESGSFMMRRVHLKRLRPSEVVPMLVPMSKISNGILPVDAAQELILRDYSSNIRRMLRLLEDLDARPSANAGTPLHQNTKKPAS